MMLLLWVSLIINIIAILLLLVWAFTGRHNPRILRIAGFCGLVGVIVGFIATR
jgi:hypothetical protein